MKEAFCIGIVPTAGFAVHALDKMMFFNQISIRTRAALAASVTMNDYIFWKPTTKHRHCQRVTSQLSRHTITHRPANYGLRVQIDNHRQI